MKKIIILACTILTFLSCCLFVSNMISNNESYSNKDDDGDIEFDDGNSMDGIYILSIK